MASAGRPSPPPPRGPVIDLTGHRRAVNTLASSSDGRLLASGGDDRTVILWDFTDAARPAPVAELTGHRRAVNAVAFSPDGRLLATGCDGDKNTGVLWDVGEPTRPVRTAVVRPQARDWPKALTSGGAPAVHAVGFSPDGRSPVAGSGDLGVVSGTYGSWRRGAVTVWDVGDPAHPVRTGTGIVPLARGGDTAQVFAVAFRPDGRSPASGGENATVTLWDVTDPAHLATSAALVGHRGAVRALAFRPDGRLLAGCGAGGNITLWDTS
ncbi:WD40 repeat domain-containing protein [Streptomyces sp. NPDC127077]|uniref:WD40 repeat domain-containing protein n=1 Tax=Streptomyces sp. NPDC127077 TaxID=3347131 RepID=UPI0036520899